MNVRMWENAATRENVSALRERGVHVLGPATGELAEGESGPGRMVEPEEILEVAVRLVGRTSRLRGRKVVVTAGPTRSSVDPVRYIGNRSSGRMGFELAAVAWRRGADVVVIAGPTTAAEPYGARVTRVETSEEMLTALAVELEAADVLVMAAAVSDFRVTDPADTKIKREETGGLRIRLEPGPDLLVETRGVREAGGVFTIGFALETEDGISRASQKLRAKAIDLVALNEPGPGTGFESDTNEVTLIDSSGVVDRLPLMPKARVAEILLDRVEERLP
jgi:phosphopantothenoylcysteine decarboxylase/phosphopantothenate--cysteine ligase